MIYSSVIKYRLVRVVTEFTFIFSLSVYKELQFVNNEIQTNCILHTLSIIIIPKAKLNQLSFVLFQLNHSFYHNQSNYILVSRCRVNRLNHSENEQTQGP